MLESVYEICLEHELKDRGLLVERQRPHPVVYSGLVMDDGFRFDLLVERKVVVEIKSVDELSPVFFKQVLTYLRLADLRLGFLINFNVLLIKNGIKRVINGQVE